MIRQVLAALFVALALPAAGQSCQEGQRLFASPSLVDGPLCVPEAPERIVFLEQQWLIGRLMDAPMAIENRHARDYLKLYPGMLTEAERAGLMDLGAMLEHQVDPELIAAARPDLIVSVSNLQETNDKLRDLAPLAVFDWGEIDGRTPRMVAFVADLLRADGAAERLAAELETRYHAVKETIGKARPTVTVVEAPAKGSDTLRVMTASSAVGQVVGALGLEPGPGVLDAKASAAISGNTSVYSVSLESVGDLAADYIVIIGSGHDGEGAFDPSDPIWQAIPAVAEGRFIARLQDDDHYYGRTPLANHLVLDDLIRLLLDRDPAEVAPNPYAAWLPR
ncbi:MAG: ABC transporter substrate-binding protein [Pseudomonadota bacterium]